MADHLFHHDRITVNTIPANGIEVCVREVVERQEGRPLVLVHGNVSSSPFFFPLMTRLPAGIRPVAIDLRGFGGTSTAPVDATRGLRDFADDVWATIDALGHDEVDLLGWSMGGGVVLQMLIDRPSAVRTVTLVNPVSPYGFGATRADGTLASPDAAGSGAGSANTEFVRALADGDTSDAAPSSPKVVLRSFYVAPGWDGEGEEIFVASMLSTATGEDNYPGDSRPTTTWPGVAPGDRGVLNTMAPTHLDLTGVVDIDPKPPILWLRGDADQIVSDTSMFDLSQLGALGAVPGWPGADASPVQPMVTQTRTVLDRYADAGGSYREVVFEGVGHSPHIERTDEVAEVLADHLLD
ncbi:alpha/beta fold hydrolase [Nakamurella sp. YIM 132087]|uniref:Alpha/beta fold hydrolase n=1 Tax=Nakamurella alba TaxID=2665158 RepID=A0A7K1FPD0_9ACTN|nr:alpha/beta hydrolase [Nakamurella alba]MTD16008.1 alpha/beta fold hydrolase [Nakamurella alba]